MYRYYDDARIMYSALSDNPQDFFRMLAGIGDHTKEINGTYYMKMNTWYKSHDHLLPNDNRTMVRWNAFLILFTLGSFYANVLLFVILGYLGIFLFYRSIQLNNPVSEKILFVALMFFPSLIFWTSGISKEALIVFALGGFMYTFMKMMRGEFKARDLFLCILFILIMGSVKVYVLFCLIPGIISFLWTLKQKPKYVFMKYFLTVTGFVILIWNFHQLFPGLNFVEMFVRQQNDFINFANSIDAGSLVNSSALEPSIRSFIAALPSAFLNVLFRPFFIDSHNLFMIFVSVENLIFLISLVLFFFVIRESFKTDPLFWFSATFAILFFALVGLSTPVMGAVVRYKVIGYMFLFVILIQMIDSEKLNKKFAGIVKIK